MRNNRHHDLKNPKTNALETIKILWNQSLVPVQTDIILNNSGTTNLSGVCKYLLQTTQAPYILSSDKKWWLSPSNKLFQYFYSSPCNPNVY